MKQYMSLKLFIFLCEKSSKGPIIKLCQRILVVCHRDTNANVGKFLACCIPKLTTSRFNLTTLLSSGIKIIIQCFIASFQK